MIKFKPFFCSLLLVCFNLTASAQAPAHEDIKKELTTILQAPYQNNIDLVIKHMHPNLVKLSGGKETLKAAVVNMFTQLKASGVKFVSAEVGVPYSYMKSEQREYCLVDVVLVLGIKEKQIPNTITQVVVKDIGSNVWSYTDASSLDDATLKAIFPDVPKGFTLVKKPDPAKEPSKEPAKEPVPQL